MTHSPEYRDYHHILDLLCTGTARRDPCLTPKKTRNPELSCVGTVAWQTADGPDYDGVWQFRQRVYTAAYPAEGDLDFSWSAGCQATIPLEGSLHGRSRPFPFPSRQPLRQHRGELGDVRLELRRIPGRGMMLNDQVLRRQANRTAVQ